MNYKPFTASYRTDVTLLKLLGPKQGLSKLLAWTFTVNNDPVEHRLRIHVSKASLDRLVRLTLESTKVNKLKHLLQSPMISTQYAVTHQIIKI